MNDRQRQILEAAIVLFVREGVGVATAKIAKAAGVSNGTLFNAFRSKQDLIDAMYLSTKMGMFEALPPVQDAAFDRATVRQHWSSYLSWARRHPLYRQIMHLLLDAGLVSEAAKARIGHIAAPHGAWISGALERGAARGPSVAYVSALVFFHLDLVIAHELSGEDEALAFDMLCLSIGVSS